MEQQVIKNMVTAITPELWVLFFQMILTVLATLVVYQGLKNLAAYVALRLDKELGKNVRIKYDGLTAQVLDINWRHLILKLENGNDVLIPITKVNQRDWEIIRNGNGGKR